MSAAAFVVAPPAEPLQLAQRIMSFVEGTDDPFALLSTAPSLPTVSLATPVPDLRTNYRKLAALIHPDRLKKVYEHATEAFQKLVRVFENVNDPVYRAKLAGAAKTKDKGAAVAKKKSQSREGAAGGKEKKEEAKEKKKAEKAKAKADAKNTKKKEKEEKKAAAKKATTASKTATTTARKTKKNGDESEDEGDDNESFIVSDSGDDSSSSDSDSSASSSESDEEDVLLMESTPSKSKNKKSSLYSHTVDDLGMKPRVARDNTGCYRTPVACPNCQDVWQPDDARHYVLLMAYGVRVFCNTCLLQFGPAAALHFCPCCKAPANYDVSMFDKKVKCTNLPKCGKTYGFASVAVTDKQLEDVREKLRAEAAKRQRDEERAARAAARSGGSYFSQQEAAKEDKQSKGKAAVDAVEDNAVLEDTIGQCMVTGSCPLCEKSVRMKAAREHVTMCMANPPKKKRATSCVIVGEKGAAASKKKAASTAAKKSATGIAAKKAPAPKVKKAAPAPKKESKKKPTAKSPKGKEASSPSAKKSGKKRSRNDSDSDSNYDDSSDDDSSYASSD